MKKIWIPILTVLLLAAILFTPIPGATYEDGGSREYRALTYTLVDWNRITENGVYENIGIYWLPNHTLSIDELWTLEGYEPYSHFTATVMEWNRGSVTVEPVPGEYTQGPIVFDTTDLEDIGATVGTAVEVYYTGYVMETYPGQINAVKWERATDLRHLEFTAQWVDPETAEHYDYPPFEDIIITEIYSNCFFAETVIPMPFRIKLNGDIGDKWCVGDQVYCTYENTLYDKNTHKAEADLLTIETSTFEIDPNACYKPVIYLYPREQTQVFVRLDLDGQLTCTYPAYENGWKVTAAPDGTLTDAKGQTYNYLYWEGVTHARWDLTKGFCVRGEDTAAFLEEALAKLGLNRREANEFIVYWLPLMEGNAYNVISFQTDVYQNAAPLEITPAPDTLIRVFMAWQGAEDYVNLQPQELTAPERTGFTVVEWGGGEVRP